MGTELHEKSEKTEYDHDNPPFQEDHITSSEEEAAAAQNGSDAVFAKASWQYKLIALVTALLLPCKLYY